MKIAGAGFIAASGTQRGHAEATVPDRAGQRDVQQAQIFRQALRFRQLQTALILTKIEHRGKRVAIVIKRLILFAETSNKRQPDQRVFQPLRFVDGDDLHQVLIAFQAHLLTGRIAVRFGDMLRQPAHQRMFAFQLAGCLLQQFADMQDVG